jgi:hypothetical protein
LHAGDGDQEVSVKSCPDCGCRVYALGCVNCNEEAYIEQQTVFDAEQEREKGDDDGREYGHPDDARRGIE